MPTWREGSGRARTHTWRGVAHENIEVVLGLERRVVAHPAAAAHRRQHRSGLASAPLGRLGLRGSFCCADFRPLSSCRDSQAALKRSCHSDRVTRDWPMALRVCAAQTETRKGCAAAGRAFLARACAASASSTAEDTMSMLTCQRGRGAVLDNTDIRPGVIWTPGWVYQGHSAGYTIIARVAAVDVGAGAGAGAGRCWCWRGWRGC